jgi:hypothetical protein
MRVIKKKKMLESQEVMTSYKSSLLYRLFFLSAYIIGIVILLTNIAFAGDLFGNASQSCETEALLLASK